MFKKKKKTCFGGLFIDFVVFWVSLLNQLSCSIRIKVCFLKMRMEKKRSVGLAV